MTAHFEMRGVRKAFGGTVALAGVDLSVGAGDVCALVGQNGAGKSTLMSILAGAIVPDSGTITLNGAPFAPDSPRDARLAGVAMIHQELSLAPHLSVMDNVALGVEPLRAGNLGACGFVDRNSVRRSARAALDQLGHADIPVETRVGELPPASQQLVEIARALSCGCRVLVLDEPTSSLSYADVHRLFDLIRRLSRQGLAIVYISHFIEHVVQVSNRYVVLRDGRNAGEGLTDPASAERIVSLMVGRAPDELYPRRVKAPGETVLELEGLAAERIEPASFVVRRGEVFGIAGLLGAGRTRLLRALFGLDPVKSGRVKLGVAGLKACATSSGRAIATTDDRGTTTTDDRAMTTTDDRGTTTTEGSAGLQPCPPLTPPECWRRGMGMLSEDRAREGLASALSVADNLTLTRLTGLGPAFFVSPSRQQRAARVWIDRLGIRAASAMQPVAFLSGGNQQKVALARLLHHDVDVLVLDEPTRGIDVASKAQIYALINDLVSRGKAVVMVSSYFPELLALCDRIAVMSRGRLGVPRPASEWTEHTLLTEASGATKVAPYGSSVVPNGPRPSAGAAEA